MRTHRLVVLLVALVAVALSSPSAAPAHPVTVLGSVKITSDPAGTDLTGKLVGFAVIANPGLEKTISVPIPSFTLPVFIDGDKPDVDDDSATTSGGKKPFLNKRLDTALALTNTSGGSLSILVTVRDADGATLGSESHTLAANETVLVFISNLLP